MPGVMQEPGRKIFGFVLSTASVVAYRASKGAVLQQSFYTFLVICVLLTITPGADTALVLKSSMTGGRKLFPATILGICVGLLFHATMSSLGLSAILMKSAELYGYIKLIGAGYLIYLGLRALYEAWFQKTKTPNETKQGIVKGRGGRTALSEFRVGLLTNILNPKVAVFYLTFLPQFVDPSTNIFFQSILFSIIHIAMSFVWLMLIGHFVSYFKSRLEKPCTRRVIESITGVALLGFGIRLALHGCHPSSD